VLSRAEEETGLPREEEGATWGGMLLPTL
jgi:hypothetical protein